ncbi:hypothetical protein [Halorubellus salinus]|uniref:hypothetical protein n=1 Tax=Halorubellus salinus TaxID=755309 RepID=UPI001D06D7B0|nr:hypothetical protein [Halorubellus salinus]
MYQNTSINPMASTDPQFTDQQTLEATRGARQGAQASVPDANFGSQQYGSQQQQYPQQRYATQQQNPQQQYGTQQQHPQQQYGTQQAPGQLTDPRGIPVSDQQLQAQGYGPQASIGVESRRQAFDTTASQPTYASQQFQAPGGHQASQPVQQALPQQPIQQSLAQQPNQQSLAQQPNQQGLAQQPIQQGLAQQPSQQGLAQQPSQQGLAQQPSQQGLAQQPAMGVGSQWLSTGGVSAIDAPLAHGGGIDDRSLDASRQAAVGAFQTQLPMASASGRQFPSSVQQSVQEPVGEQRQRSPTGARFGADASTASKIPLQATGGDLPIQQLDWASQPNQQAHSAQAPGVQSGVSTPAPIQQGFQTASPKPMVDELVTLQDGTVTTVGSLLSQASMTQSMPSRPYGDVTMGASGAVAPGVQGVRYGAMPVAY